MAMRFVKYEPVSVNDLTPFFLIDPETGMKVDIRDVIHKNSLTEDPIILVTGSSASFGTAFANPFAHMTPDIFKQFSVDIIEKIISEIDSNYDEEYDDFGSDSIYEHLRQSLMSLQARFSGQISTANYAKELCEELLNSLCCEQIPVYVDLTPEAAKRQINVHKEHYKKIGRQDLIKNLSIAFLVAIGCVIAYFILFKR